VVLPIADERVAQGRKLRSNLILQACRQLNPNQRSIGKKAFDGIAKFSASRLGISRRPQLLEHSFTPKIVDERPCLGVDAAAQYRQVLPYRGMREKLAHERIPIRIGLGKQQNPGNKTIDAMHDQGSLFLQLKFCDEQRQSRRSIGPFYRHSQKSGRFIDSDDGIVFVQQRNLAGEGGPTPIFLG
jgi:hypothetical protein